MVESASGKGSTGASNNIMNSFVSMFDDFFTGNTHDGNFDSMMKHYAEAGNQSDLNCFW
jgi:tRNA splicing ligase